MTSSSSMVLVDSSGNMSALAFPKGIIALWSGSSDRIPNGWTLCDGNNESPNLSGRFVVGVGTLTGTPDPPYRVGDMGGYNKVTLTVKEIPAHTHITTLPKDDARWGRDGKAGLWGPGTADFESQPTGGGQPHENRPPFYALCYIMRL